MLQSLTEGEIQVALWLLWGLLHFDAFQPWVDQLYVGSNPTLHPWSASQLETLRTFFRWIFLDSLTMIWYLQYALPCFEGMFPHKYDGLFQDITFTMATWHGFAKLRMHTDHSVAVFDGFTTVLGQVVRDFSDACDDLEVYETVREAARRVRRQAAQGGSTSERKRRAFNMYTYKWHVLTHYPQSIPLIGTLDIASTQKVWNCSYLQFATWVIHVTSMCLD